MKGSVRGYGLGNDGLKRIITFSDGSGVVLEGNVFSYGTEAHETNINLDKTAGNHITFKQGDMKGSVIASRGNGSGMEFKKGYNNITFSSGGVQKLTGGILAEDDHNNGSDTQATNTLNVGDNTTLQMIADSGQNTIKEKTESLQSNGSNQEITNTFQVTSGSIIANKTSLYWNWLWKS